MKKVSFTLSFEFNHDITGEQAESMKENIMDALTYVETMVPNQPDVVDLISIRRMGASYDSTKVFDYSKTKGYKYERNPFELIENVDGIVYVSEHGSQFTKNDILVAAKGNTTIATRIFEQLEWQTPHTLFAEGVKEREWTNDGQILSDEDRDYEAQLDAEELEKTMDKCRDENF